MFFGLSKIFSVSLRFSKCTLIFFVDLKKVKESPICHIQLLNQIS